MHFSTRIMMLAILVALAVPPLLNAQYVRIGNADAIPSAIRPPTIIKSMLALYTDDARTHGVEGTVTVEAVVDENGQIRSMRVLKGLGFGLDKIVLASVQEWMLSPATRDGVPVSVVAQIDVQFDLRTANAFRVGNGVSVPKVLSRVEPHYTEEAARAKLRDGQVVLQAVVKSDGTVDVISVVQGMAFGMTDSAIAAIKQWRFSPGQKDGKDVDVALNVEINFHLK